MNHCMNTNYGKSQTTIQSDVVNLSLFFNIFIYIYAELIAPLEPLFGDRFIGPRVVCRVTKR